MAGQRQERRPAVRRLRPRHLPGEEVVELPTGQTEVAAGHLQNDARGRCRVAEGKWVDRQQTAGRQNEGDREKNPQRHRRVCGTVRQTVDDFYLRENR